MNDEELRKKYRNVCEAPSGSGFRVERMPDFFADSEVDDCAPHVHTFYEILWFQEGTGCHTVDFTEYEVKPNTIFFISPGQIHHFDKREGYRGVAIKMCTDFMQEEEGQRTLQLKYQVFHSLNSAPLFRLPDDTARTVYPYVEAMEEESAHSREYGHQEVLHALLRIFLVMTERACLPVQPVQQDRMNASRTLFLNFRKALEQHYTRLHGVQDYAELLHVSVRTLNKCVNENAMKSPLTFINDRVMLEAKRLVRYSDLLIKEIATDLGYDDPSYFVKFFKRQTGYLPVEFRNLAEVTHCPLPEAVALNSSGVQCQTCE